jgi:pilus assembly protein CpaF
MMPPAGAAAALGVPALDELLALPGVTELMLNGGVVWIERAGTVERASALISREQLRALVDRLASQAGARVDRARPLADVRLPNGWRANLVVPPAAPDGPLVTVRRFTATTIPLADFAPPAVAALLQEAVAGRRNIVVAGATGSGKTTLLNALAGSIAPTERIITVEETAELRLDHPHVVRLEAQRPNADGAGEVTVRQLVVNALRMRPDRIVVGEVRGGEVLDMAQAMNTGHAGSLCTCHANSPRDALRRLEAMAMLGPEPWPLPFVRSQLQDLVDLVVQVGRASGGRRAVTGLVGVRPGADWQRGEGLIDLFGGAHQPLSGAAG